MVDEASAAQVRVSVSYMDKLDCLNHKKKVNFICQDCTENKEACDECVNELHIGHFLIELKENADHKRIQIKQALKFLETIRLPSLSNKMDKIDTQLSENEIFFHGIEVEIENRGSVLKKEIDKMTQDLQELCKSMKVANMESLHQHRDELTKTFDELISTVEHLHYVLEAGSDTNVYKTSISLVDINIEDPADPSLVSVSFDSKPELLYKLKELYGELVFSKVFTTDADDKPDMKPFGNPLSSFKINSQYKIECIKCGVSMAWITGSSSESCNALNIDSSGNILDSFKLSCGAKCSSVSKVTGHFWILCSDGYFRVVTEPKIFNKRFLVPTDCDLFCLDTEDRVILLRRGKFQRCLEIHVFDENGTELKKSTLDEDIFPSAVAYSENTSGIVLAFTQRNQVLFVLGPNTEILYQIDVAEMASVNPITHICFDTNGSVFVGNKHKIIRIMKRGYLQSVICRASTEYCLGPFDVSGNVLWACSWTETVKKSLIGIKNTQRFPTKVQLTEICEK